MDVRVPRSSSPSLIIDWVTGVTSYSTPEDPASQVTDLERRILAPCCRRQVLADHDSEPARALRSEIRWRIVSGEASCAVERDLMRRYGDDIRVMPRGWAPRSCFGASLASVVNLGALVLTRLARRQATDDVLGAAPAGSHDDDLEIDEALRALRQARAGCPPAPETPATGRTTGSRSRSP